MFNDDTLKQITATARDWERDRVADARRHGEIDAEPRAFYVCATWADCDESYRDWLETTACTEADTMRYYNRWEDACDAKREIEAESGGDVTAVIIAID